MHAAQGDWLIVERADLDHEPRRGLITEVRSVDGAPPYLVHWTDNDHIALVYPGPDARVITEAELAELNEKQAKRFTVMQHAISGAKAGL